MQLFTTQCSMDHVLGSLVLACVGLITQGLALIDLVAFLWPLWSVRITYQGSP